MQPSVGPCAFGIDIYRRRLQECRKKIIQTFCSDVRIVIGCRIEGQVRTLRQQVFCKLDDQCVCVGRDAAVDLVEHKLVCIYLLSIGQLRILHGANEIVPAREIVGGDPGAMKDRVLVICIVAGDVVRLEKIYPHSRQLAYHIFCPVVQTSSLSFIVGQRDVEHPVSSDHQVEWRTDDASEVIVVDTGGGIVEMLALEQLFEYGLYFETICRERIGEIRDDRRVDVFGDVVVNEMPVDATTDVHGCLALRIDHVDELRYLVDRGCFGRAGTREQ